MKILLVDDQIELTEPLSRALSREGYIVDVASNGLVASELLTNLHNSDNEPKPPYDLLILDWLLPEKTGLTICQEFRSHGWSTPVLFLTAKDTLDDRVAGLDAGADDYLVKPFELRELLARVRALLRRSSTPLVTKEKLQVEDLELDCDNQLAYRQGRAIELSEKEYQLLEYLAKNHGQLLTHHQIYQYLWGTENTPNSNVLAAQIRLLRKKIELAGEKPLIHTVYGRGYRFGE